MSCERCKRRDPGFLFGVAHLVDDGGNLHSAGRIKKLIIVSGWWFLSLAMVSRKDLKARMACLLSFKAPMREVASLEGCEVAWANMAAAASDGEGFDLFFLSAFPIILAI